MSNESQAAAIIEFAQNNVRPQVVDVESPDGTRKAKVLVTPEGLKVESIKEYLDEYLTAPERRRGTATLLDLNSFIEHTKRFADADSVIFADPSPTAPKLLAVLDYHRAGADKSPRFGQHRGSYAFPLSDEWKAWTAANKSRMSQVDFAEFIENRVADLAVGPDVSALDAADPLMLIGPFAAPARVIELSRGLAVHVGEQVREAFNVASGESTVQYVNQHNDVSGQPLKVPTAFSIAIPVFKDGAHYRVDVRLRYRVKEGGITWFFELYRADKVFDDAFKEACTKAKGDTGLPLFVGSPEA